MICFFGRSGGTGDTASATSATSTASGRSKAQAIAAATSGMTTLIASTERRSKLWPAEQVERVLDAGSEADCEYGQDDAGLDRQKHEELRGHEVKTRLQWTPLSSRTALLHS